MSDPRPEQHEPLLRLTSRQQATVAAAVTLLATTVIVASFVGLGWLLAWFVRQFSNVLLPLAVAAVAALVVAPYQDWLRRRARMRPPIAATVVVVSVLAPIIAFLWFFGSMLIEQVSGLVRELPALVARAEAFIDKRMPEIVRFFNEDPWGIRIRDFVVGQQESIVAGLQTVGGRALSAGAGIARGVGALFAWAVLPVYFVFFLMMDRRPLERVEEAFPFFKPDTRRDLAFLVREFVVIVVSFFRGQILIALLQGLLFAIGFSSVGLTYGFVLGLMLGLLNIVPYLGNMIGLAICLPLAALQPEGGLTRLALVLGVFAIVQMVEGYLLTPKIMGDRTGLHPLAILVAIFFWGTAFNGILGMILAIPLTAFLVVFWRLLRERYIGELV